MRLREITMAGLILLMVAFVIGSVHAETNNATTDTSASDAVTAGGDEEQLVDDIVPEEGIIGPRHILYKFSRALDDLDVAFTFNESEKIAKQVSKARQRLAEIKSALKKNDSEGAEIAIEQFDEDTLKAEEAISRIKNKDTGLLRAQLRNANHSYVLERLIESHPNNTGLLIAYNNSERLLEKFATKTSIKLERLTDKMGRKVIRHVRIEDDESGDYEKTSIKASVEDKKTHVKLELKFLTNSTEPADIAGDILDRIDAIESNVSDVMKIEQNKGAEDNENDGDEAEPEVTVTGGPSTTLTTSKHIRTETKSKEKIKAEAEVKKNTTRVNFEYSFVLNETENSAIISGVKAELSALTADKILGALDVKVIEKRIEIRKTKQDDRKKPEISGKRQEDRNPGIDREDSRND